VKENLNLTTFKSVWIDEYPVYSFTVDIAGRLQVPVLCQFMQESAWHHARHMELGYEELLRRNLVWVLTRQIIQIDKHPHWQDTVQIQTWPTGCDPFFCYRDFHILNEKEEIIARASTSWSVINLATRRIEPTSTYYAADRPRHSVQAFPGRTFEKIPQIEAGTEACRFSVRYSDLDPNQHVNNVKYIEWALNNFDADFHRRHQISELEINYLAEAFYGDSIRCSYAPTGKGEFLHDIVRESDQKSVSRVRTRWLPVNFPGKGFLPQ